jgi:glycosyltransferase involved in cell wall biosynthesis
MKVHPPTSNGQSVQTLALANKRIIIVLGPLELGGSERQALLFARYLKQEQQADVQIWGTMGGPGRVAAVCDEYEIPWRIVPQPWVSERSKRLAGVIGFARRLRSVRPDVILPYMWLPSLICNLVFPYTGAKLCLWNQRDHGLTRIASRFEPRALRNARFLIANSQYIANYLITDLGADPRKVRIVRNGVELAAPELDRAGWRRMLGVSESCYTACMVGNLHQDKDHVTLLQAWKLVLDRTRSANNPVLLIAGRFDNTHEALQKLTRDLGMEDSVRFLGQVQDIAGLLGAVDLSVFSSRSEGSPNGVLESMAAGLPVVATNIPAIREAVPNESVPFLVPAEDPEAMARATIEIMNGGDDLRRSLGDSNRKRVHQQYSKRQACNALVEIILEGLH